jgi:hypothetical protein
MTAGAILRPIYHSAEWSKPLSALTVIRAYHRRMQTNSGRWAVIAGAIIVVCICIGVGVHYYRADTETGWVKFLAPDGDFSILMPGQPEIEEQEARTETGGTPTTHHFLTAKSLTSHFFCYYWDLSYTPADETDTQMGMAGARDGMIHELGGKLLSHDDSMSDGHSAQSFQASLPDDGILEGRFSVIGRRQYMLAVARPAEDTDEETQKFFSSFKLSSLKP